MNKKPSVLLKDVTFDFEESEDTLGPHIALTFKMQGGAASGYNKPLLFKSEEIKVTPELIELIKNTGEDTSSIEKALYNSTVRGLLDEAIRDKGFTDTWDWTYIEDFDDSNVIFYCNDGLYSVGYSLQDMTVTLDEVATPVISISDYTEVEGDVLISEDMYEQAIEQLDEQLSSMVNKAKNSIPKEFVSLVKQNISKSIDKVVDAEKENSVIKSEDNKSSEESKPSEVIIKNNNQGELSVDNPVDIQKAIDEAVAKAVEKATKEATAKAELEKAELKKSLEDLQKAEEVRIHKAYVDVVKSFEFVEEEKVENLVKALMANPENSEVFIEALMKAKDTVDAVKAEFAPEKGVTVKTELKKDAHSKVLEAAELLKANKNK